MSASQLLMISDIEGCVPNFGKNAENPGIDQNTSLCELSTYTKELTWFLTVNPANEIAFLGDYFDKGPGVAGSIIGIAHLHAKFPKQVHIILGNRDINKFRIAYEIDLPIDKRIYTLSSETDDEYAKSGTIWVKSILPTTGIPLDIFKNKQNLFFEIAKNQWVG